MQHEKSGLYYDIEPTVTGCGSIHSIREFRFNDPILVRGRPIEYTANIDVKPVYRVLCYSKKIGKQNDH